MTSLLLRRTSASGDLLPARFAPVLARWRAPRAMLHGQELRLGREIELDDDAAAGFILDFLGQGARVEVNVRGASVPLVEWAFHALAAGTKAELVVDEEPTAPAPDIHLTPALAYLDAYEADVKAHRRTQTETDGDALVAWLVREELLAGGVGSFAELPLDDAARAYELLLESPAVEELFLSERELARLLTRFRARDTPGERERD